MKKFKFNLENVLRYRERMEDNEKAILTTMHGDLNRITAELNKLREEYKVKKEDFETQTRIGMTIQKALEYQIILKSIGNKIESKINEISIQNRKIQKQTQVVVAATQDRKILDKLKENKYKSYVDETNKAEEKIIEELASNRLAAGK